MDAEEASDRIQESFSRLEESFEKRDILVGLALDITGAILLARGLLLSPRGIAQLAYTWQGVAAGNVVDRCRNRVDAVFGLASLVAGFSLQAIGYALQLGGVEADGGSGSTLVGGLVLGIASASLVYALYHSSKERLLRRLLVTVTLAAQPTQDEREPNPARGWTVARMNALIQFGVAAGWPINESPTEYARRVFGVRWTPNDALDGKE